MHDRDGGTRTNRAGIRAAHLATLCDERGERVWSKRRFGNRLDELEALVGQIGDCDELTVVMEPTRNAWVPVAAHFMAVGARVVLVPAERSADLRRYYAKHTKNDRLDSHVPGRLPLLHPEGLHPVGGLGPAEPLRRAVRRRVKLVEWRLACRQRIDAMLDLLGPGYARCWEEPVTGRPLWRSWNATATPESCAA